MSPCASHRARGTIGRLGGQPVARVARLRGGPEKELRDKGSFTSEREADINALRLAQRWVNRRLRLKQWLTGFVLVVGLALAAAVVFVVLWMMDSFIPGELPVRPNDVARI